eukprot:4642583-Amphidinium_carterae.1
MREAKDTNEIARAPTQPPNIIICCVLPMLAARQRCIQGRVALSSLPGVFHPGVHHLLSSGSTF